MATLAELEELRDYLFKSRAKGYRAYEIAGRRLEYKSDAEQASALADLDRKIAAMKGTPVSTVYITSTKGLES